MREQDEPSDAELLAFALSKCIVTLLEWKNRGFGEIRATTLEGKEALVAAYHRWEAKQ